MKIRVGREDRSHHSIERDGGGDSWKKAMLPTIQMSRYSSQALRYDSGGKGLLMSRKCGGNSGREIRIENKCYKMVEKGKCKNILLVTREKQREQNLASLKREVIIQGYVHSANFVSLTYFTIARMERLNSCKDGEGKSYGDSSVIKGDGKKGLY